MHFSKTVYLSLFILTASVVAAPTQQDSPQGTTHQAVGSPSGADPNIPANAPPGSNDTPAGNATITTTNEKAKETNKGPGINSMDDNKSKDEKDKKEKDKKEKDKKEKNKEMKEKNKECGKATDTKTAQDSKEIKTGEEGMNKSEDMNKMGEGATGAANGTADADVTPSPTEKSMETGKADCPPKMDNKPMDGNKIGGSPMDEKTMADSNPKNTPTPSNKDASSPKASMPTGPAGARRRHHDSSIQGNDGDLSRRGQRGRALVRRFW